MVRTAALGIHRVLRPYLRGYAAVLFCSHDLAGLLILAVTFIHPEVGACGLLSAIAAHLTARHLRYPEVEQPPEVYNALLVGLALGAAWQTTPLLLAIIAVTGVITALATHVIGGWLWRLNKLPVMSLTFVLIVWALKLAAHDVEILTPVQRAPFPAFASAHFNDFFTALGWFLYTPHPTAGLAMFVALLISSRYLALLCVSGYVIGTLSLWAVGSSVPSGVIGFNFMLSAMAVGGLFAFPDRISFIWGMFAALFAALLTIALAGPLAGLRLPLLAAPFLMSSYLLMAGLSARPAGGSPRLLLEAPALPERSLLTDKLARARLSEPGSYPVQPPFFGGWKVSQGIDGNLTHRGVWRDAFDFIIVDERGRSFRADGKELSDYYSYGAPVLAPVSGLVWRTDDRIPDNAPGEIDARPGRNFGNHLMLRTADGTFVLLGHLKQASLVVKPGAWVEAGQIVAACGNSGRSTQPHIHLQAQFLDEIGAPTRPLHLRSITVQSEVSGSSDYLLAGQPAQGAVVSPALPDQRLAEAMHLPAGRTLLLDSRNRTRHQLTVELSLLGQFRISTTTGASAGFDELPDVLAFFDRQGPRDACLDAWMMAVGLTPFSAAARTWIDAPSVELARFPLGIRIAVALLRPFGAAFTTRYKREWMAARGCWQQTGQHRLALAPGFSVEVSSEAIIDPATGVSEISVRCGARSDIFVVREIGSVGDVGVQPATVPVQPGK